MYSGLSSTKNTPIHNLPCHFQGLVDSLANPRISIKHLWCSTLPSFCRWENRRPDRRWLTVGLSNAWGELIRKEDLRTTNVPRETRGEYLHIIYFWRPRSTSAKSFLKELELWAGRIPVLAKSHLKKSRNNWARNVWDLDFMMRSKDLSEKPHCYLVTVC